MRGREVKILEKAGGRFALSREWIHDVHDFAEAALSRRTSALPLQQDIFDIGSELRLITFPSLLELDRWLLRMTELAERKLQDGEIITMHYKHGWWPLVYTHENFAVKKKKERYYFICERNTPADVWCCGIEKRMGFNVLCGVQYPEPGGIQVFGDILFRIFLQQDVGRRIRELYAGAKSMQEFDVAGLLGILGERCPVHVLVIRDKSAADAITRRTLEIFRSMRERKRVQKTGGVKGRA